MVMKSYIFDNTEITCGKPGVCFLPPFSCPASPLPPSSSSSYLPTPTSALPLSCALPPPFLKIQGVQNNLQLLQFDVPLEIKVYHKCFAVF